MNTTHDHLPAEGDGTDALLESLADADPADAPSIAEHLAASLSHHLDAPPGAEVSR